MIARIWQARIDPRRADDYDRFARERSLPTFRAHRGFRGCAFLGDGADRTVLTLWDSRDDIEGLERSAVYRDTVEGIMRTGFVLEVAPTISSTVESPLAP